MLGNASMITAGSDRDRAVLLSTRTRLDQPPARISSAHLTATAHGIYEASINGMPVPDRVLVRSSAHRLRDSGLTRRCRR